MPRNVVASCPLLLALSIAYQCDLNQDVRQGLMAEKCGLSLLHLKKTSEYSSVTTTSVEYYDNQETQSVSTPVSDADDHLSDIASSTRLLSPEMLTPKHSALVAQSLMEEVSLCESTPTRSHYHAVFSMPQVFGAGCADPSTSHVG